MLRNVAKFAARHHRFFHANNSQTLTPCIFRGKMNGIKVTSYRRITSGTMIEGTEAPSKALMEELQKEVANHQKLAAKSSFEKSKELKQSLESIRSKQFDLEMWEDCLKTEKELYETFYREESLTDIAESHGRLGTLYSKIKYYSDGLKHLEKALSCWQRHHANMFHVKVGDAWNALAALRGEELDLENATKCLSMAEPHYRYHGERMIDFGQTNSNENDSYVPPTPHPDLRLVLENQAHLLRLQNLHKDALNIYHEVENLWGRDRDSSLDIADCLMATGEYLEAKKLYENVWKTLDPEDTEHIVIMSAVLHQMGMIFVSTNDPQQALNNFEKAYELRKKNFGEFHPLVGTTVNVMGVAHASLDQPGVALDYFHEALMIARRNSDYPKPDQDPIILHLLSNIQLVKKNLNKD
jgi:tetratricopeptide (TPR) repeat protein